MIVKVVKWLSRIRDQATIMYCIGRGKVIGLHRIGRGKVMG